MRGSWRPNRNCNILTPTLMAVNVVSFSLSRAAQPEAQRPTLLGDLLHLISSFSGPQTLSGFPRAPSAGCGFPYDTRLQLSGTLLATQLARRTQLNYIIVRRMFNRHLAEITIMQFRGHSLPVHQSMSVPWEFFLASPISSATFRPRDFLT